MQHHSNCALRALTVASLLTFSAPLFAQETDPHSTASTGHAHSISGVSINRPKPVFIDFDHDASGKPLVAPALFNPFSAPSLSTMYASLGVTFSGPGGLGSNSGGVIVDQVKGYFTVPTRSGANFLAFLQGNYDAAYASGPETMHFSTPVTSVTIYATSPGTSSFTMQAYNGAGVLVDSYNVFAPEYEENNFGFSYYPLSVHANAKGNISRVTLTQQSINPSDNIIYEYDDLTFVPVAATVSPEFVLSGRLALEGVGDLSHLHEPLDPVTFSFRTPGTTTTLFTISAHLKPVGSGSSYGAFQFVVSPGTYDIAIKSPKTLRVVLPNVTIQNATTLPDTTLRNGDANNDNSVDVGDFGLLINAYGGQASAPGSGYDPMVDFNYDGSVDVGDFGILINDFGSVGAP